MFKVVHSEQVYIHLINQMDVHILIKSQGKEI
jgi:hypothetical protein